MRHYSLDELTATQGATVRLPAEVTDAPISILKNYAKTLFNKCAEQPDAPLTPMEQAKFDAAQAMMRDGKTTRYAFYKYKAQFEKPLLANYRDILSGHAEIQSRGCDLSDTALRKVANFIDGLDADKLAVLKEDRSAYADFVTEAYMISHVRTGRSKSKRIAEALDLATGASPAPQVEDVEAFNINKADLHSLIRSNLDGELDDETIDAEINNLAERMQKPLSELASVIQSMPAADREADGIQDNCFFLFKKFIGMNTNSRRALGAIGNMMSFMTACFTDRMPEMIGDLKAAEAQNDYHGFMSKYASPLIKTYQYLAPTGYLTQGAADVDEDAFIGFVQEMDAELDALDQQQQRSTVKADVIPIRYSRGPEAFARYTRFGGSDREETTPVAAIG